MHKGLIDLVFIGAAAAGFLAPLLLGYFGFGRPDKHHPFLKKGAMGIAGLQATVFIYFGWIFTTQSQRHVNHVKWIAPLTFFYLLIWFCFGSGYGLAALRYRIKNRARQ